jgi:putative protease
LIDDLIAAGVTSFKIEGRLKGGPYVAATCQTYRKAIDAALSKRPFDPTRREELDLAQTFSRGLTHGFLDGNDHQRLVRGRFPKSRGVRLGTVTGFFRNGVQVKLAESLPVADLIRPGDGVLFDLGRPDTTEPGGRVWAVRESATLVELQFDPENIDLSSVKVGCEVWKTDDPALKKRLEQSYSQDKPARRVSVRATVRGEVGGPLTVSLTDDRNRTAIATWPGPLEVATKRATTGDEIRDALSRLGETPYELGDVAIDLPASVLVPKSVLNDLRRRVVADLLSQKSTAARHLIGDPDALSSIRTGLSFISNSALRTPHLTVLCRTLDQLDVVLAHSVRPRMDYCDFEDLRRYADAVPRAKAAGIPVGLATLRIQKPGEEGFHGPILRARPDAVLIRTLGGLGYFRSELPAAELIGDFSLNVSNDLTADLLVREGCSRLVPSFDLNWEQLKGLLQRFDPARFEPVIHQHMPMFHMEHCVFAAFLSTGKDHRDCGRPCDRHTVDLKDRVGAHFPVTPDTGCRNTVFNSVPQSAAEYAGRMRDLGVRTFRIDLLRETPGQIGPLLDTYARVLAGQDDGRATWKSLKALNQLGVTRGTLQLV